MDRDAQRDWESALVCLTDASEADLRKIALGLGYWDRTTRDELARALIVHPNFGQLEAEACIKELHTQWWGDEPNECRAAWEALERALAAWPRDA